LGEALTGKVNGHNAVGCGQVGDQMLPAVCRPARTMDQQQRRTVAQGLNVPAMGLAQHNVGLVRVRPRGAVFGPIHASPREGGCDRVRDAFGIRTGHRHISCVHRMSQGAQRLFRADRCVDDDGLKPEGLDFHGDVAGVCGRLGQSRRHRP